MRITQVELTNIKSYRGAMIALQGGTTAIRGRNGAGKSTLVEAIGFALFDALPYKQAQFVREGERVGTVVITFVSALDDREYQVVRRCGSSSDWFVYDPAIDSRAAEQKADVLAFLRDHLRVEGEVALDALFNDAIGVPQGTFTQDFLMTPALRKKKFDALLQVEDYRKAAERLNDTRNFLQDAKRDQQKRIDDLERETNQLPAWRMQQEEAERIARELTERLQQLTREAAEVEQRRERLRAQEAEVARLAAAAQVVAATRQAAEGRASEAEQRAGEAREAVRVCRESLADFQTFGRVEQSLAAARQRARERDVVLGERAQAAQRHEGAKSDLGYAQRLLEEARRAEQRVAALSAAVQRQSALECQSNALKRDVDRLQDAERARERLQQELSQAEAEIADAERKIAQLDALQSDAEQLPARRERFEALQRALEARRQHEQRHARVLLEEREACEQRAGRAERERKARDNVRKLEERREEAEQAPRLEADYAQIEREVRSLETSIAHARGAREQSGAGVCPFLAEPCLNIARRGENNLGAYFDRLISADELKLTPVRRRLEALSQTLEQARKVASYYERLPDYQERLRQAHEDLAETEARLARIADERAELEQSLAAGPTPQEVQEARAHVNTSMKAETARSALGELRAGLSRATERRASAQGELAQLTQHIAGLSGAPERLRAAQAELDGLGDPKTESQAAQRVTAERGERETRLKAAAAVVKGIEAELARLEKALRPFAGLEAELQRLEAEQERARPGHLRYVQHEQLAGRRAELEEALANAQHEAQAAGAAHEAAMAAYAKANASFDAQELTRVSQRADALGAERGSLTEGLRHTHDTLAGLREEIARVEQLLVDLSAARDELARLDELERLLQQFRDTIKEAGPYILKAVLQRISLEANRIFGEILGDRSAQLSWEQDYEIVLRRDGRERTFAQLSGGEQMSAALAVRLALLRSLSRLEIAFFDEPTQNMDDERRGNLAEQIRRVRGFEQLIVISHDDTFEQGLDSVIHLDKRGGETLLVKDEVYATP
ncbi:MAG TPA: SMC family ATPase [Ktedonobacterales bacterium]